MHLKKATFLPKEFRPGGRKGDGHLCKDDPGGNCRLLRHQQDLSVEKNRKEINRSKKTGADAQNKVVPLSRTYS